MSKKMFQIYSKISEEIVLLFWAILEQLSSQAQLRAKLSCLSRAHVVSKTLFHLNALLLDTENLIKALVYCISDVLLY